MIPNIDLVAKYLVLPKIYLGRGDRAGGESQPLYLADPTDIRAEAGAIDLRYIPNVNRRYCSPQQPSQKGVIGALLAPSSSVEIQSCQNI